MLIRADEGPQVAWKNGGGVTREIASVPAGAGMDSFAWRLSAARVDVPGPFSHFTGVDRTIAILSGRLLLKVGAVAPIVLTPGSEPYTFPGDVPAFGTPENGPVLDLNLMVRRGAGTGVIRTVCAGPVSDVAAGTILLATQEMDLRIGARTLRMQAYDAFRVGERRENPVTITAPATIVTVALNVMA